jgi:hypothetical protein
MQIASIMVHRHVGKKKPQVPPLRYPRISCRAWWRWQASCGFLYGKPHTRPFLRQRSRKSGYALSKNISKKGPRNCRSLGCPGFPVESDGFREAHAAFLDESRKRGHLWCRVVGNPGTLGMTKGRATLRWRAVAEHKAFFIPWVGRRPMTTPVGMTRLATVANGSSFLQNIRSGPKVRFVIPTGA